MFTCDLVLETKAVIEINGIKHYLGEKRNGHEAIRKRSLERLGYRYIDISQMRYKEREMHRRPGELERYLEEKLGGID